MDIHSKLGALTPPSRADVPKYLLDIHSKLGALTPLVTGTTSVFGLDIHSKLGALTPESLQQSNNQQITCVLE